MNDDPEIDKLIRPPRRIFEGFEGSTDKLRPTGAALKDKLLAEKLSPSKELPQ